MTLPPESGRVDEGHEDEVVAAWFLSPQERGNPATDIDRRRGDGLAWTTGNLVRPLVHGALYFRTLHHLVSQLEPGDRIMFTDWRGDADEKLLTEGPTVGRLLCDAVLRGVEVRGLVWRSHPDPLSFPGEENFHLGQEVNGVGGEVLLDMRVRRLGSHHQKLFLIRHPGRENDDVAFCGGIDLSHSRRDDAQHDGDPQPQAMDPRFGPHAPWHDTTLEVRGPAVGDLAFTFAERWNDPTPLDHRNPWRRAIAKRLHEPRNPSPLPPPQPDPAPVGPHAVQVLRTYACKTHPAFPFAPEGERSVARAYQKALARARSCVYVEDQYLWSEEVANVFAEALRRARDLHLVAVVPRFPDADSAVTGPPNRIGQLRAIEILRAAGGDRVGVFDIENESSVPIYVHAKTCIVDDTWMIVGSDNLNIRSWTQDSELSCAVLDATRDEREPRDPGGLGDGARRLPRNLRLQLWAEHLGRDAADPALLDAAQGLALWRRAADELDQWHEGGRRGTRPAGRVRHHDPVPVTGLQRWWAQPLYRTVHDPDGRPRSMRGSGRF